MAIVNETPLLMDELTTVQRVVLGQVIHQDGYKVIVELMEAACARAHADTVKLDPEDADYDRKLSIRTQRERSINGHCALMLKSIKYHVEVVQNQAAEEQQGAVQAVAKTFGYKVPSKSERIAE